MSSHDHRTLIDIGKNLLEGLTSEEVMLLLGALLETMPSEWHEKALMPLSEDTKLTIQNIVMPPVVDAKPVKSTSIAKLEEVWATLWKDWDRVVREGMDDEGKYMVWENRWEPSYFEEFSFVIDLEAIAEKMLPLIDTAIAYQFSPKADFIDALSDAEQDVENHLPDSIEFGDGLALGKPLTTCLLKAEWLLAEQRGIGAFGFVLKIKESEEEFRNTSLNTDTFLTFFSKLTEADQRVIFDGFDRHRNEEIWQDLQDPSSMWHTLYINYLNRYAPERYIDVLRETIPQKWQNGLPIIKDLLAKKSYKTGFDVAQETLDSMLRGQHRVSDWTPQKSLYFGHLSWQYSYNPDNFESERRLFVYYEKAAGGVGQTDLANILAIQVLAFDKFFNWEAMLKGLREKPLPDSVYQTFLTFWVESLSESAKPGSYWRSHRDGSQAPDSWWVTWLFESIIDTQKGKVWFQQKMRDLLIFAGSREIV